MTNVSALHLMVLRQQYSQQGMANVSALHLMVLRQLYSQYTKQQQQQQQ